jgi:hypothetical protein
MLTEINPKLPMRDKASYKRVLYRTNWTFSNLETTMKSI